MSEQLLSFRCNIIFMKPLVIMFLVFVFFMPASAPAQQVYKCNKQDGSITFSDKPCGDNAQSIYIENNQSGISTNQSYDMPITERHNRNRKERNSESQQIARAQREAKREYDRVLRETNNSAAATRAASVVVNSATHPQGRAAKREFDRVRKETNNSIAAERAANAILGRPGAPTAAEPSPTPSYAPKPQTKAAQNSVSALPIPNTRGEWYFPTSPSGEQYTKPGGGICNKQGSNLNCDGVIKPASGVVVEPHRN